MTPATRTEAVWSIDDLELELRKLPGVCAAGFDDHDDVLLVQLHISEAAERLARGEHLDQPLPVSASRIAARHSDRPVTLEVVRWRSAPAAAPEIAPIEAPGAAAAPDAEAAPESIAVVDEHEPNRARLLAVLAFPDTDELEVHLVLDGKRTIGRAPASAGVEGAVVATLDAVHDLGTGINARLKWARTLDESGDPDQVAVAVALDGVESRSAVHYGLAGGTSVIDAAARATLDALNRTLSRSPVH